MKKLTYSIVLLTAIISFTSAQQIESKVTKVLNGEWKWVSFAGGEEHAACTDAPNHYLLQINRNEAAPGLFYSCRTFKDSIYISTTTMLVTEDASNPAFPYKLHYDVTSPLFNGVAMPSVNFRIVADNYIEFSNGIKTDYLYLFENVNPNGGC